MYPVIGSPPLFDGALHDKVTEPSPAVPLTAVGAPGTVAGVMAAEGVEGGAGACTRGGAHGEGVGGAVGQAADDLGGGARREHARGLRAPPDGGG